MTQPTAALLKAGAWAAALFGVLSLQYLPDRFFGEHSVCGPWGCGAPLPALLACHGFWLVLFAPATVYAARQLKPQTVWWLGAGLVSVAGVGLAGIAVWQAATWWQNVDPSLHRYAVERYLFVLATLVDVPVLETLVGGVTLWWAGIWRSGSAISTRAHPGGPAGCASDDDPLSA
jgi:hypothetical protein